MAVNKEDVMNIFEKLPEAAQQSVFDYIQYLLDRHHRPDWDDLAKMEPDDVPLSEEEKRQLDSQSGFMSWEEAMRELDLPSGTKS